MPRPVAAPTVLLPDARGHYQKVDMSRPEIAPRRKFAANDFSMRRSSALDMDALSRLVRANPERCMEQIEDLIEQGKFTLRSVRDLRALWKTFAPIQVKTTVDMMGLRASVTTSAFPLLMGNLVVEEINRAYDSVPTVGELLVRELESNKKITHLVKIIQNVGAELRVKEGDEFPTISAGEQFSVVGHDRKGFQLVITAETLEENDVGNFLELVDQSGQFAAELREEQTLSRVYDQNGSANVPAEPYVFRPNGAGAALYNTAANANNNQTPNGTRVINNPLTSGANLDVVRLILDGMLNPRKKRIGIPMSEQLVLVPAALLSTILKITESEMEPGVFNEQNNWGPKGRFRPGIVSTPKIDDITTTSFIMGAFQRQFVRKHKIRLETVSVSNDPMAFARTREAYRTRVCWDMEVGARDNVFCVQSLAGAVAATAPAASNSNP